MHKKILFCLLSTVLSLFIKTQTHATATIPEATNKFYAQNNIIFTLPYASDDPCATQTVADYGDLNNRIITAMSFLTNKGYSINAAAAIVGNLIAESSLVPNKIEGGRLITDTSWRLTSWENYNRRGFGIAQWTSGGRQTNLQSFADENNLPVVSLDAQLGFLVKELQGTYRRYGSVENLNSKSLEEATFNIYRRYETPRSSFCTTNDRAGCYNDYAPSSYNDLSETATSSAYSSWKNRFNKARDAISIYNNRSSSPDNNNEATDNTDNDSTDPCSPTTQTASWNGNWGDYTPLNTNPGNVVAYTFNGTTFCVIDSTIPPNEYVTTACSRQRCQSNYTGSAVSNPLSRCDIFSMWNAYEIYHGWQNGIRANYYFTNNYSRDNLEDLLPIIYDQLMVGRPVIFRVMSQRVGGSSNSSHHWVTVVGVRRSANINSLTANDFLYVDPHDAKLYKFGETRSREIGKEDGVYKIKTMSRDFISGR